MVNVIVSTSGTSGPRGNSILSGTGAPSNSIGFDGDFYLNVNDLNAIYGPKANGIWPPPVIFGSPLSNLTATVNPSVNDDITLGYEVGSVWVNTNTDIYFVCSHNAVAAAVWTPVLPVGTAAGTVAAGDDPRITGALQTGQVAGGDLSGTLPNPTVTATHLSVPLPLGQGGTGSSTKNFVDLTTNQNIAGAKTFTDRILVPAPTSTNDAVNVAYVQGLAGGLVIHEAVAAITVVALPANTYFNGVSGVGATLTATAPGVLVVDDYTVLLGDRIYVKNEAAGANNGIYTVTTLGTVAVPYVLTRAVDMDDASEIPGAAALAENGTVNKGSGWVVIGSGPFTVGTTPILISQFSSPGFINVGLGLRQVGNTISLETPVDPSNLPEATPTTYGVIQLNTDLGGIATSPQVVATHLASPLPLAQGGTAASTASGARTSLGLGTSAVEDVNTLSGNIQPLGTQSAGASGLVADAGHVHPTTGVTLHSEAGTSVVAETSYGQVPVVGVDVTYSREDHSHGTPSLSSTAPPTTQAIGTTGTAGTSSTAAHGDHVHPMAAAGTPSTSAVGDTPATGNATTFAASNHTHGRESFGVVTPLNAFGTASSNGTATTVSHSDHVHGAPTLPNATSTVLGVIQLTNDLSGTAALPTVAKINGTSVPATPTTGQVLTATSPTSATWQSPTTGGAAGGDLSGTYPNPTVAKVTGVTVSGTPSFGTPLTATSATTASWTPLPNVVSTGILTGGVMTINTANSFNITQTTAYIADFVTTPASPTVTAVNISAQTVTLGAPQTTQVVNYWFANSAGTISSQTTPLSSTQKRTNILLGITWSALTTGNIFFILAEGTILNQAAATRSGIAEALGVFSTSGNFVSPNGANLNINKSSGNLFGPAIGYYANGVNNPDQISSPLETLATFKYVTQATNSLSAARTTVDVTNYDVAGTVTLIPGGGGTTTNHRVWLVPTGTVGSQIILQYGQSTYTSLANAQADIGKTNYVLCPDLANRAALIGWITVEKSATALNNTGQAIFTPAGRFARP